ncbi:MAG TPA: 30S ribosomal protein S20 [Dehalococcoidales bacterium]|nr:30S ribosomal protein S20 [Dehalococcoidales bacterium]
MPTTKTAEKEMRAAERKHARNKSERSRVKTSVTSAENMIASGNLEAAKAEAKKAASSLDKERNKGISHANSVSRRKSRLMKKLNKASAQKA